jgi:hypothetical protein
VRVFRASTSLFFDQGAENRQTDFREPEIPRAETMLQIRPNCECCDLDLPPDSPDARICSFECTFCALCAENVLAGKCPNCAGELVRRPIRPAAALAKNPASPERVLKKDGCAAAA